jgi:glycosyltransferase involved in cell wall biosynthesis
MKITIFTPTFNREYILPELYQSLLRQTSKDFEWLIIDDGSSDKTSQIVKKWIDEKLIPIRYIYQENMGMVAAHNTAHHNIHTELNVCIDSDDYMPNNAVEIILKNWEQNDTSLLMGMVGLDAYKNGGIIGTRLPNNINTAKFSELLFRYKVKGDKKYVLNTKLIKKHLPYPFIPNEKFPAPSYMYLKLEKEYDFLLVNEVFCIVEYLPDGNSMNKVKQIFQSPNAFALYRIERMKYPYNFKDRFKNAVHYVSSKLIGNKKGLLKDSPAKLTTMIAFPFGFILSLYLKRNYDKPLNKKLNK